MDAIALWENSGKTMAEVARELGIAPNRLYRWREQLQITTGIAYPGTGRSRDEEMERLRKEYAEMKVERDILKKALAIFSKHDGKYTNS